MAHTGPDRRGKSAERRGEGPGKPPPGTVIDRRLGLDPRQEYDPRKGTAGASSKTGKQDLTPTTSDSQPLHPTDDGFTGLERKRGRGRRLSEFTKSAEEGEMTTEQFLFLMAIDAFKKGNDRMFPTWTDVLEVIRLLGYRKTTSSELNLPAAEDWLERSDAPANVRPDRWAERFTESGTQAGNTSGSHPLKSTGPMSEQELTDEALEAFEAAFSEANDEIDADFDVDSDLDEDLSDAA